MTTFARCVLITLGVLCMWGCADAADTVRPPISAEVGKEMGVAQAYRVNGVVTLTFFGNRHGMSPEQQFVLLDRYGVQQDRSLFPPGTKTVTAVPDVDVLTYEEAGPDANAAGSLVIHLH